ncbi:hypothetical protein TNCV_1659721 [Trichonephila clavipes]|nr:hypothetical protein TNCV_1659721 [Trichonephila clavipes]
MVPSSYGLLEMLFNVSANSCIVFLVSCVEQVFLVSINHDLLLIKSFHSIPASFAIGKRLLWLRRGGSGRAARSGIKR